ncbi:MAG TPA: hypothetical protein VM942_01595 [Acidimicrobiales bacterium]|nr:hypothetical protein [Acidimicrobiales bacterium]
MVSVTSTRRTSAAPPASRVQTDERASLAKWLRIWVGLLTVVTLVVVAYLTFITNSLANINGNLGTVSREVGGAGTNVVELPSHVDRINDSLAKIDTALKPIPGQAGQIVGALSSINDKLGQTDTSLKDTAVVLQTTMASATAIANTLVDADEPGDNLGVQDIHQRIARINGRNSPAVAGASAGGTPGTFGPSAPNLSSVQGDARSIVGGLDAINGSLTGICRSTIISVTSLLAGPARC